jgi:hypothetical protein
MIRGGFCHALGARAGRRAFALMMVHGLASAANALTSTPGQSASMSGPAKPPELIEIVPSSGPAGQAYPLQATIRGTGFMPTGNLVEFGPVKIPDLPATDGSRITFAIPKSIQSRSEVPPLVLQPGEYQVTVTTSAGTSNPLSFLLRRGP